MISLELRDQHDSLGNADHLLKAFDRWRLDFGLWHRACGDCICDACGKPFHDHPPVIGALYMTRLCRNKLVKL